MQVEQKQKWIGVSTGNLYEFDGEAAMVSGPEDVNGANVAALVRKAMPNDGQEHLIVLCADAHGVPLAVGKVATGSVDNCPLYARDVYAFAMAVPRTRFVGIAHNHPSGDVRPSGPDKTASTLVARIGKMLAMDLLWSMVVTHENDTWAIVPLKHKADETGEKEPSAPKDPEPDKEPGEEGDEDEGDEGDGNEPEPGDEQTGQTEPEPEPDQDGDEGDEDGDEDEGTGDPDEDGDGETPEEPEDEDGDGPEGDGDHEPETMQPGKGSKPEASMDDLKAAIRAAFKLHLETKAGRLGHGAM